jgi:hypothetical protein
MSAAEVARNWNTIIAIATLGTNRGPPALEKLWLAGDLAAPSGPPERSLLRSAAINYLWHLAGARVAAAEVPAEDRAPTTDAPVVKENAAWRLARMLAGDHRDLVPEWLSLAARAGAVLPPHWLPVVLNGLQPQERAAASSVLGPRAEWLAKRNPEWAETAAAVGLPIERWNNGTLPERREALATMRVSDPTGARIWLERSWDAEPPHARVAFLETLINVPGLSEADEAFLEAALNDKRKDVRTAVVECLCRLPGSQHARRNIERLEPLVNLTEVGSGLLSKLRKRRLEITLPESLDKSAARDGINAKPPAQQTIGERAYWLMQMIATAQPAHWCERFQCDVDTFITAASASDYAANLLVALSNAAVRHRDATWIAALSTRLLTWYGHPEQQGIAAQTIPALVAASPSRERDAILRQLLAAIKAPQLDFLQGTLVATQVQWSAETTRLAFDLLNQCTEFVAPEYSNVRNTLTRWGSHVEVATASGALVRILERTGDKSPWRNALEALNEIIEFRLAMRQELST